MIAQICNDAEVTSETSHHEDTDVFEQKFRNDSASLHSAFLEFGNPFSKKEENVTHLTSNIVMEKDASDSVRKAWGKGEEQYEAFVKERTYSNDVSFYDNIKKNNFPLFREKNSIAT